MQAKKNINEIKLLFHIFLLFSLLQAKKKINEIYHLLHHKSNRVEWKCILYLVGILKILKARGGGPGSKKQVWLISKSNLSWSYYFSRNRKIFVYDENMVRQSFKMADFWQKTAKSWKKIKNSKIYFQHFLGLMVLHIWSKFHVSSLIFEGEDLF